MNKFATGFLASVGFYLVSMSLPTPAFAFDAYPPATFPGSAKLEACEMESLTPAGLPLGNGGLQGNSNYLLYASCEPLINPSASITFDSPLTASGNGFDFQFNADSLASAAYPKGVTVSGAESRVGWQQFIINVHPGTDSATGAGTTVISGFYEPWPTNYAGSNGSDLAYISYDTNGSGGLNSSLLLATLQNAPGVTNATLPAGLVLTISPGTDSQGNVNTITFTVALKGKVLNPGGKPTTIGLIGLPRDQSLCGNTKKNIPADPRYCPDPSKGPGVLAQEDLGPITTFTLDFAGQSAGSLIPTGSGQITYSASNVDNPITPMPPSAQSRDFPFMPVCATGAITAESSNVSYGTTPSCTVGNSVTQSFSAVPLCGAGTAPYFFSCDDTAFCASDSNVETCLSNGWCSALPWTSLEPTGKGSCTNVTAVGKRDGQGAWLSSVGYSYFYPPNGVNGGGGLCGVDQDSCPAGTHFSAATCECAGGYLAAPNVPAPTM